ncbi:flagellar hook assembly protein FlgD [Acetobacteraceae bacterium ESL0709]|nr:flagellar hook assembly protein FlgD [Acetobacteraceae bacterium ESL0697]MDF7679026.1 flagellar hook assembly protein FlgD [Acetobacteraceae bacterium ESL0709]
MPVSATNGINNLTQIANQAATGHANTLSITNNNDLTRSNTSTGAFQSLAQNENQFLALLTTQLKHQDPTSPMDNQALASELAQFSSVEQQVQTNKNLESLISLNEMAQLSQSNQLVGKIASVQTNTLPLQDRSASLEFSQPRGQNVAISVADTNGKVVKSLLVSATGNSQDWKWDGKDNDGNQLPDGAYSVAVKTADSAGNIYDVPFLVSGKITGVVRGSDGLYIEMGNALASMSAVKAERDPPASSASNNSGGGSENNKSQAGSKES